VGTVQNMKNYGAGPPADNVRGERGDEVYDWCAHEQPPVLNKMRKTAELGGLLVLLIVLFVTCGGGRPATAAAHVRVLATHDFHGALRSTTYTWSEGRPVGGAVAIKTVMDRLEAECACPTVRLDGGDQMQGTLESNLTMGASTVAAFNAIGLDAAAVGNHELDWGVDTLLARQREASYPWLAANVFHVKTRTRPDWARPYAVVERAGAKLGVVGYATVMTPSTQRPEITKPYDFRSGYAAIRDALDAVWQQRPDFVAIVAHAGGGCSAKGCAGEMVDLALQLPPGRVHLIVGGHDHSAGSGAVNSMPIIRAGADGRAVGVVDLHRSDDGVHTFNMAQQTVYADDVPPDDAMAKLIAPFLVAADVKGKEVVTTLDQPLPASAAGDRRLGSLITDAVRLSAKADVGLHNPGGVRADLPRGPVSYAALHRVLPFGNTVVRLTLSGRQLRQLVSQTRSYYYSNLTVDAFTLADGTAIRDGESYTLATNDFLADGGDGLTMLTALPRDVVGVSVLDAFITHLRK
jgi:2',3'-cyclic-nucleotide 2'-phosphodiesterase/3'-nucleotidase